MIGHRVVAGLGPVHATRRVRVAGAALLVLALAAVAVPTSAAQPDGAELPDLISDPPRPSYFAEITLPDGSTHLVVTFDGYVHNIGDGALDVVGNPQEVDGMQQRVRDGDDWVGVGAPTVRFETDDGHNHFHLISAVEYVLWNETQGSHTATGSKVGFCLVDSEQMEPGTDQQYSEELDDFCQENNPDATALRMGISPGWRDIYDATTTLQWVDVSTTAPGRYWIGAITDPNDEIVESDETNNDLIFSERTISVPGFSPRVQAPVSIDRAGTEITLATDMHGTVTRPVFVIEEGPSSGVLDVPIGSALGSPILHYFPGPDFDGSDSITFSVRDASSPYPFEPPRQTIELVAASALGETSSPPAADSDDAAPSLAAESTFFETMVGQSFETRVEALDASGDTVRVFAAGLPAGLVLDPDTGVVSGVPREAGIFDVRLTAIGADPNAAAGLDATWIVNAADTTGLEAVPDRSSPYLELTRVRVGTNRLGLVLEADGLPPGLELRVGAPVVEGAPTEVGVFPVTIREIDGQDIVAETTFTWTIRPSTAIDFVL